MNTRHVYPAPALLRCHQPPISSPFIDKCAHRCRKTNEFAKKQNVLHICMYIYCIGITVPFGWTQCLSIVDQKSIEQYAMSMCRQLTVKVEEAFGYEHGEKLQLFANYLCTVNCWFLFLLHTFHICKFKYFLSWTTVYNCAQ